MSGIGKLSPAELHQHIFENEILPNETFGARAAEKPRAIITGGQPGSGRSMLVSELSRELLAQEGAMGPEGCVVISVDRMHRYLPRQQAMADAMPGAGREAAAPASELAEQRAFDCNVWADQLLNRTTHARHHLVIDQASENPEAVRELASRLHRDGYEVEFRAMAVKDVVSEAHVRMFGGDQWPSRLDSPPVTKQQHDAAYEGLAQTVQSLDEGRSVDAISLHDRSLKTVYANGLVRQAWNEPAEASRALSEERDRPFTFEERHAQDVALQRIERVLHAPENGARAEHFAAAFDLRERSNRVEAAPNPEMHGLGAKENERVFQEEILPRIVHRTDRVATQDQPRVVIVEAQPGAAKNASKNEVREDMLRGGKAGGFVEIDASQLHKHHRDHDKLMRMNDRKALEGTQPDVEIWIRKAENFARDNGFDVLVDGTATSHEKLADRCSAYRHAGYHVEARTIAMHERASRQNLLEGYEDQRAQTGVGVMASREAHDAAYRGVAKSLERVEELKLADRIRVDAPNGKQLYLAELEGRSWKHAQDEKNVKPALEAARNASWSPQRWEEHAAGSLRIEARLKQPGRNAAPEELRTVATARKTDEAARQQSLAKQPDKPKDPSPGR